MSPERRETIAITGVTAWTGGTHKPLSRAVICVTGDRISAIGEDPALSRGARSIHFENAFAIPGLIDCHVHMGLDPTKGVAGQASISLEQRHRAMDQRAEQMVRCGITTARDLGGGDWAELELRDRIQSGRVLGPRLLCAGQPLTTPGGHCHFWGGEAGTPEQIRAVLDRQIERGVDWIKVMATGGVATRGTSPRDAQFDAATLTRVVALAQAHGRSVAAHCHGTSGISHAARSGVRTIEHCSFAGDGGFGTSFDPAVVEQLAEAACFVSPTVNGGWAHRTLHEGKRTEFFERMARVLRSLVAARVPLVASTDAGIPGVHHHRLVEGLIAFALYAELDGDALLRTATVEAARALGLERETGRLARGLAADLVILSGDPRKDPEAMLRPLAVFARGRQVTPLPIESR